MSANVRANANRAWAPGFTLIEMLVVLAVMGLIVGIVIARGPARSTTVDLQAASREVAQVLRLARSQAIAMNRPVRFVLDPTGHVYRVDFTPPHALAADISLSITAVEAEVRRRAGHDSEAGITFSPDGSSTGGRIEMSAGGRRVEVGVDWLTGRVAIAHAP